MRAAEIKVGCHYIAKVSGRLVTVRVDEIREVPSYLDWYTKTRTVYAVTNLATSKKLTFRSPQKFRRAAMKYERVNP